MSRQPKPWWNQQKNAWCSEIGGKRRVLAHGKKNRRAAVEKLKALVREHALLASLHGQISVAALCEAFLEDAHQNLERRTYESYQYACQMMCSVPAPPTPSNPWTSLTDAGYLARVPIRAVMPSFPHVYVCSGRGLSVVARAYQAATGNRWKGNRGEQRRATRGIGAQFIAHELDITDLDLAVFAATEQRTDLMLAHTERRYYLAANQLVFDDDYGRGVVEPDTGYHIVHERNGRRWLDLVFAEVDRGTMRPALVADKLRRYERFAQSDRGVRYLVSLHRHYRDTSTTRPTFRLALVCRGRPGEGDDQHRLVVMLAASFALSAALRERLWMTTHDSLVATAHYHEDARIWMRASDSRSWPADVRHLAKLRVVASTQQVGAGKRQLVAEQVRKIRCYTLLPPRAPHAMTRGTYCG